MIRSFRHSGLERFYSTDSKAGIQPAHAVKLRRQLSLLDASASPDHMDVPGWRLHPLKGNLKGHWSVRVSGNWRLLFKFEGEDAVLVDYQDYHKD
jgi:proteic killer suppression protein